MSMIGNFLRVTPAELTSFLNDSSLLEENVYEEESENGNPNLTDIDKSWDGILYLLTGETMHSGYTHPLAKVIFSEQLIDEEQDMGYGPAHYLTAEQVAEINLALKDISTEVLKQRFDPEKMMELEIYPTIWDERDGAFDYLNHYFKDVQQVFAEAVNKGQAIITFIN